jgi:hypothetical protein
MSTRPCSHQNRCVSHLPHLEHLLYLQPTLRGRVPLRSTSFRSLRRPWTSRGAQVARLASSRVCDRRRPMGASRGTRDARSDNLRRPLEDKEAQNNIRCQALSVLARCFGLSPARPADKHTTGREWLAPFPRAPIWATTTPEVACST